ncbi:hypothetical protein D9M68_922490 [compost metagenome]
MPSKFRSLEKSTSLDMKGLPKRPPVTVSQSTGLCDIHIWSSHTLFLLRPPPSVWVVDTGLSSLPDARRTPALVFSERSANTPSRARARNRLRRSFCVLRIEGRERLVLGLTS